MFPPESVEQPFFRVSKWGDAFRNEQVPITVLVRGQSIHHLRGLVVLWIEAAVLPVNNAGHETLLFSKLYNNVVRTKIVVAENMLLRQWRAKSSEGFDVDWASELGIRELPVVEIFCSPNRVFRAPKVSPQILATLPSHTSKWHIVRTSQGP